MYSPPVSIPRGAELLEEFAALARAIQTITRAPVFTAPSLQNSWVNFGGSIADSGYYKDPFGRVHLRGVLKNGTATPGTVLFTLPTGSRPSATLTFAVNGVVGGVEAHARVDVNANGDVTIVVGTNTYISLNGISFAAV